MYGILRSSRVASHSDITSTSGTDISEKAEVFSTALRKADALNRRLKFSSPTNCADIGLFITE